MLSLLAGFKRLILGVWRLWRLVIQFLLGAWVWEAPPWGHWLQRHSSAVAQTVAQRTRRQPLIVGLAAFALIALSLSAIAGWRWYEHRPKPQFASFSTIPPRRTRIEDEKANPDPLLVRFDRSTAALALAGHELPAGVTVKPALPGKWRWVDDRVLEFRVESDWPIGQKYAVTLDRSILGPEIRLASYEFTFTTTPFGARVSNVELYQDPVNPGIKKGVFDIQFTHPVNPAEFESRVELRLAGQSAGVLGVGRETTPFTVVYDKLKLNASVHSAALPIPHDPTELQLLIGAGVAATRGGNTTAAPLSAAVAVPGLYSLASVGTEALVVSNDHDEPEQVLSMTLSAATGEGEVSHAISARLLPKIRPAQGPRRAMGSEETPYDWYSTSDVTEEVLAHADTVALDPIPAEREFVENHAFRYHADVGRYVYVQIEKNLRSFGGYLSPQTMRFIVRVPPFPPQLKILSQGSLLALSGDHKVVALVRDLPGLRVDIGRVLPEQLQHLISQSEGDFSNPVFNGTMSSDNLIERFERKIALGNLGHGKTDYEPIDLGPYLQGPGAEKRGIFLLTVKAYDPKREAERRLATLRSEAAAHQPNAAPRDADVDSDAGESDNSADFEPSGPTDSRLVLVTDLGILAKRSIDGTQDVFVQSIQSGEPVAQATVEIIAKNGSTLFSQLTDSAGRAHFLKLEGLVRERTPLFIQVKKGHDLSFLPLNRADRNLDFSRFDIGGIRNARNANEITSYLFSDRGLYRPGDTLHIGMITKTADWSKDLAGIPLEAEILDARGLTVKRERFAVTAGGFAELSYTLADTAPTGTYNVNLYIVKDNLPGALLGTTNVRVQEFEPDRLKVNAHLSRESLEGWVSPTELKAIVNVQNLFGTPAEHRRVTASLTLTPAYPAFRALPDYRFYDPQRAKEGYEQKLNDTSTDAAGNASFDLGLEKYTKATYRVHLLARAFEPDSGRSVAADAAVLVSELPLLVGFKPDGDLDYVSRDSTRAVTLIAIDPAAKKTAAPGLRLARIETKFVSVLSRQINGTYKYESRKKETPLSEDPYEIPATGATLTLNTDAPGTYAYVIHDASGLELNRIEYTVAGQGNVTRSLERNAELQITLNKKDYSPGEEIELSIKAPYTGAGLITIERDHIYATEWFKSSATASVQKIRLPADFEGNGYVSVQFIRDAASEEIFTSPLSYGVAPFMTALAQRSNALTVKTAAIVKPGADLHLKLETSRPTRAVLFAVDEGILQVAHYQAPDPLGEFFKKRALEVRTAQILDLILPEFKRIMAAAPGGDGEAALRRNLNPFKRKRDNPAVYWSGIVDVQRERDFKWTIPDTFNGTVKVFALSVNGDSIGIAQTETVVRGDFVLTPNMPAAVAPGDEFEVSVGVANQVVDSGNASVIVSAALPPQLEAVGPASQSLSIAALHEGVALFRFRARAELGSAPVTFTASWQTHDSRLVSTTSVRPASPYVTEISAGYFAASTDIKVPRVLYPNFRKLNLGVSALPLALAGGLRDYLNDYPHLCTEQLVSRGFPALVIARRPELAEPNSPGPPSATTTAALVAVLRSRQNAEGGFGLWADSVVTDEFASVYAVHWMLDAREQGEAIPIDLWQRSLVWLQQYASSPVHDDGSSGLRGARNRAYATYLLTRQGVVTTPIVAGLRETLDARYPRQWQDDVAAAYMASIYQLQRQDRQAAPLIEHSVAQIGKVTGQRFSGYYDDTVRDAEVLYLLSRHFPERARALEPRALQSLVTPLSQGNYNTLTAGLLVVAFDAYASAVPVDSLDKFSAREVPANGKGSRVDLTGRLILQGHYGSDASRLHLDNDTGLTGFYAVTSAGFDRAPPTDVLHQGIEIFREYLDAQGQLATTVKTGDEITVHLRMRAIDVDFVPSVAMTDLLPGGFETVLNTPQSGNWTPDFVDVREDRIVLYGTLSKGLAEYAYRIRATNAGTFLIPPSYAESMYDRSVRARALPGKITIGRSGAP